MEIENIEKIIGYSFKDKSLLEKAFIHSSARKSTKENYQRLEFLGDSILDFVVAKRLMELFPNATEGELTKMRAAIVSKTPLAEEIERQGLQEFLVVGKGENRESICSQEKIMSDIFEAIVAGIYYDSNSIDQAEKFILSKLSEEIAELQNHDILFDYKSQLNEKASKRKLSIEYIMLEKVGPPHSPIFKSEVLLNGKVYGSGQGKRIRYAEQEAAKNALKKLK